MLFAHAALNLAPGLSANARRVAGALLEHYNQDTGRCDPGIKRLQNLLEIGRTSVVSAIKELCRDDGGFFKKLSHGGQHNTNFYVPRWDRFRTTVTDFKARMNGAAKEQNTDQLCRKSDTGCAGKPATNPP